LDQEKSGNPVDTAPQNRFNAIFNGQKNQFAFSVGKNLIMTFFCVFGNFFRHLEGH
jgi:hypothetical protein